MIKLNKNRLRAILRVVFFVAAATTVILILPREGRFSFEFQKGRPWMHETLIAPFDFSIYKSKSEIVEEKALLFKSYKPYFDYDSAVFPLVRQQVAEMTSEHLLSRSPKNDEIFNSLKPNLKARNHADKVDVLVNIITKELDQCYKRGVVSNAEANQYLDGGKTLVPLFVLHKGVAEENLSSELYSIDNVVERIIVALSKNAFAKGEDATSFVSDLEVNKLLYPNVIYSEDKSNKMREEIISSISLTKGMIQAGDKIIAKGEPVRSYELSVLESLKKEYEARLGFTGKKYLLFMGHAFLSGLCMLILYLFLYNFRREILMSLRKTLFILLMVLAMVGISAVVLRTDSISLYLVPFVAIPIFVRTFYDSRLALFIHIITILLVGFQAPNSFEFVFINFMAGVVAIFSLTNSYRRGKIFVATGWVFLVYALIYLALSVLKQGNITSIAWFDFVWFAGNAFLILVSYQLVYLFEKVFGFLSDTTLIELSDHNQVLLRRLADEAPGTFQHSLQVANLAEAAVFQIGGNPLLVKLGGLYHDIGKLNNPMYYIENQVSEFNPHSTIELEESAQLIIRHVADGVAIAKKYELPEPIIDFIRTHHGTSKVHYFYRLYRNKYPDGNPGNTFNYPGPRPMTKETAVLMMADAVEAASRSLSVVTPESIDELVESIVNFQQMEDQFNEADITFKDITTIKTVFKKKLLNMYHVRVVYPQQ